jgi:hypothetical protein
MFYKRARSDKIDILNTDLVNFLNTKDDYENIDDESEIDHEDDEDDEDEDEVEDEENDEHDQDNEHENERDNEEEEDAITEIPEDENVIKAQNEEINLPNMNLKDMFSNITQLNFGNIDFNKMQQELIQSGILESNSESKIEEIIEPLENNEQTENQNEMTEASDIIDIPIKKKRGRKPKNTTEQQQTKPTNSKIQISK